MIELSSLNPPMPPLVNGPAAVNRAAAFAADLSDAYS